jgi:drug/metabolite transporter (DMT)-like permease
LTKKTKAEIILLSMTIIWGGTFAVVKNSLNEISPLFFVGTRFLFAAILFIPFIFSKLKRIQAVELRQGIMLGTLLFFGMAAQTIGMQYTTASKAAFLTGTMVVFTPLIQFIMGRRPPLVGNLLGVLLVTIGLFIFTSPRGSVFNFGDGLNLACAIVFGIYTVYVEIAAQEGEVFNINFIQILTNSILCLFSTLFFENVFVHTSVNLFISYLYLTILATMLTLYLLVRWQKETTPTRAAVIYSVEPIIAAVIAYILIGELLPPVALIGSAVIISGLFVSEFSENIPLLRYSFKEKEKS